jgi:light-regulated signal transduction histidine kinase (bacteriophytochrome)
MNLSGAVQAAEIARLEHELAQAKAELQHLTYTVSHDLRAPLRHINAYAQVIQEDMPDAPADILAHLDTIRQSAQLLGQQLDALTTLSRLSLQSVQLQATDVNPLARDVADELNLRYAALGVQWQLAQDVPPVRADANLLRQVLVAVLDNACKFSRGREPALICLSWHAPTPAHCQICVRDQGVGFAPEQAQKLFKVFGKLHPARDFEGLGIGLVHSRKILERMGGHIDIQADPNVGCCVTISLPLL